MLIHFSMKFLRIFSSRLEVLLRTFNQLLITL